MNLIKWIKRKSILKKRIIFFEKKLKNASERYYKCTEVCQPYLLLVNYKRIKMVRTTT